MKIKNLIKLFCIFTMLSLFNCQDNINSNTSGGAETGATQDEQAIEDLNNKTEINEITTIDEIDEHSEINDNIEKIDSRCELIPEHGPCKANFTKYFFDKNSNECGTFFYGGCAGVVPFDSLAECKTICEKKDNFCNYLGQEDFEKVFRMIEDYLDEVYLTIGNVCINCSWEEASIQKLKLWLEEKYCIYEVIIAPYILKSNPPQKPVTFEYYFENRLIKRGFLIWFDQSLDVKWE